jgi:hypothetical protein
MQRAFIGNAILEIRFKTYKDFHSLNWGYLYKVMNNILPQKQHGLKPQTKLWFILV